MKKFEHTITVNQGDTLTLLVRSASGNIIGRQLCVDDIVAPKRKHDPLDRFFQRKESRSNKLYRTISKYSYAIQHGKWINGSPADIEQVEEKLCSVLQTAESYDDLSYAAIDCINRSLDASTNPAFLDKVCEIMGALCPTKR